MKRLLIVVVSSLMAGCWGYSSVGNELVGQAKKVHHYTPLVCPPYDTIDISLGVMQNGVGSMSTHDMELTIWNDTDLKTLEKAAERGSLVKVKYSNWRMTWCREDDVIDYAEALK